MNRLTFKRNRLPKGQDYGLHILVDKDPGEDMVDIVAIHGLNGHYEQTWTTCGQDEHKTLVNWLRDLLPHRIQNARIMSFAYNSVVQFSKSTADIYVFADQLLGELLLRRQSIVEERRPLVFVCHSLGGIVFKQAMNKAHSKAGQFSTLLNCVQGVVFMGTPHRGSDLAPWGAILSSMLRAASLGSSTNSQLTKDLEQNSRVLNAISASFVDRGQDLKIFSLYETEKLDYLNALVVGKESATLGWPQETCIALNANHRSMCWSTHLLAPVFQHTAQCIAHMTSNAKQLPEYDTFRSPHSIHRELHTSDYVAHKGRNPEAVQGTCVWLFRQRDYRLWVEEAGPSLLWISADPGCGKSVLASFLVDHHERVLGNTKNILYFFFKAGSVEQRSAVRGLSAILHQLYTSQPELMKSAQKILQLPGQHVLQLATLWRILTDSVDRDVAKETLCIIDGLDECEESSRRDLISLISRYFTDSDDQGNQKRKMRLLITSRPDNSIKIAFERRRTGAKHLAEQRLKIIRLRGEDEIDAISADAELVIKDAIQDLVGRGLPQELLEENFLWTTLIIDLMKERAEGGASQRELDMMLQSRGVHAIYSVLLNSKVDQTKTRKLLSVILAALEPLTVGELNIALAIQPDHYTFEKSTKPRRPGPRCFTHVERDLFYPAENHIKSLGGHFVRIIQGKVYLVHQTAREFLLDAASNGVLDHELRADDEQQNELFWDIDIDSITISEGTIDAGSSIEGKSLGRNRIAPLSPWQHTFSLSDAHALLLETCITYLYLLGKTSPKTELGYPTSKMSAFLRYAARSWLAHFHQVCDKIPVVDLPYYHGLCHPRFPGFRTWTEFRSELPVYGQQDYLVLFFGLEPVDDKFARSWQQTEPKMPSRLDILSSNPAATENFYFPVKADATGYVSLDFNRAQDIFKSSRDKVL
ncbi:ankyrin repeat protein [Xylariales sp. AK1849]|nr:ankyrin repeat protein [Xylariales sp. AK1849]